MKLVGTVATVLAVAFGTRDVGAMGLGLDALLLLVRGPAFRLGLLGVAGSLLANSALMSGMR